MMTEIADILLRLQGQVGVGSLNSIVSQCGELGIKKPLIVTDPVIVKIGLAQRVVDLFSTYGQQAVIFDQCVENPLVPD
ncbi:MAG: iron-containing alcohol dehydrogenase, partial [Deltaproteobacteria bacterium]|nr:iron-containing alcohol dehydrogenase [Deltaproteobacteria bacterium]